MCVPEAIVTTALQRLALDRMHREGNLQSDHKFPSTVPEWAPRLAKDSPITPVTTDMGDAREVD